MRPYTDFILRTDRAERNVNKVANYRYTKNSSFLSFLDDETKKMYMLIGVCAAAVLLALVLCLTLQSSCSEPEIPVVEQGDGAEDPGYYPNAPVVSGDLIIDDGNVPVTEFDVMVKDADGRYQRSEEGAAAEMTISGQNSESFAFELKVGDASVNGTAYFSGAMSAVCEKAEGTLNFEFDANAVYVYCDGIVSELGEHSADGMYLLTEAAPTTSGSDVTTEATTTTTTTAAPQTGSYDLDLIKSDSVKNALSDMMSIADYNLTRELLDAQGGYGIIYGTGDSSLEKDGRSFNLDTQMNAILYYSFEPGTGREAVVICAGDGRVYAGVCDGADYRYYTNDSARSSAADAPTTIVQYAKIKGMTLEG